MEMQTPAMPAVAAPDPADIVIAQAEVKQRRRRRWLIVGGVSSLLVSYIMSPVLIQMLYSSGLLPNSAEPIMEIFCLPLTLAYRNSEWMKAFYDWYFNLFGMTA